MIKFEKIELTSIVLLTTTITYFGNYLPQSVNFGQLIIHASVVLLIQGLIRDIAIIYKNRKQEAEQIGQQTKMQCMCLESSFGFLGIIIGEVLLFSGLDFQIPMKPMFWGLSFFSIVIMGFLIKDYIFVWNPFGIRKEKNHMNVIFSWKK